MTTLTVSAELAPMDIGVAVCTVCTYLFEYKAGVATYARNLLVHPAKGIAGLIMVEFRIRADWRPTRVGMAILTGDRDGAMRVGDLGLGSSHLRMRIARRLL